MKILLYGAGALGSLTIHYLVKSGHEVTAVARRSYDSLQKNGVIVNHYLQKKITIDKVNVVKEPDKTIHYDAVLSVMQSHQQKALIRDFAQVNSDLILLIGNQIMPNYLEHEILKHAVSERRVLFGFQSSAGHREGDVAVSGHLPITPLYLGGLHQSAQEQDKKRLEKIFRTPEIKISWIDNMQAYYLCHMAEIMPYAYLAYACDCDLRKASKQDIRNIMTATNEMFAYLKSIHIRITPPNEEEYYQEGFKAKLMYFLYYHLMTKTVLGELMVTDHCKNAVEEMQAIDAYVQRLRTKKSGSPMPTWDSMREIFLHQVNHYEE